MSDTPERPEPASSTSAENSAPAESPSPGPPPAPQAESAARNAEPASAAPAPEPPASAAAVPETPAAEAPAPEPPASAAATPPAPATGDAAPAAAPDLATPATAPPAPSALPVPAPAPSALPVPAPAPSALPVPAPAPDRAAPPPSPPSSFFNRVKRVFNFETDVYPEVAADGQAALEAIVVIAVSSLLFGSIPSMALFFIVIPLSLVQTAISAGLVSIAAKLFNPESPGFAPWFRALGFAEAPLALGLIPFVGSFVGLLYWIVTGIAAIHRVARLPVGLAILTWVVAWLIPFVFLMFLVFLFGGLAFVGSVAGSLA
jgi:hypothetical protein